MNQIICLFLYDVRYDTGRLDHLYFMVSIAHSKEDTRLVLLEERAVGNQL